jgi:hypothetical protein
VPNTHDLVISDATQGTVVLLSGVGETDAVVHILAEGIQPDFVAATRRDELVILADSKSGIIWAVEPKTATVYQLSSGMRVNSLALLRDGHTTLLSVSPSLSLLQIPAAPAF